MRTITRSAADGPPGIEGDMLRSYLAYDYEYPPGDCPRIYRTRAWALNWSDLGGVPHEVITNFADNHDGSHQMTTPDGTVYREVYGDPGDSPAWKHGLVTSSEVKIGSTVQKTTTTSWTQDNEGVAYQTNPRVFQTLISDGTNNRKTAIGYQTFTLPVSGVSCSLPNDVQEFDANQTTVLRRTHTDYITDSAYLNLRLIGLADESDVYQGTSALVSKTTYCYDCDATMIAATASTPIQHDSYFDSTDLSLIKRGDLMVAAHWDVNDLTNGVKHYQHVKYDTAGNVITTYDASNHATNISYADKFSADGVYLDTPRSFSTFAYPTTVTDADGFSSSVWYDYDFSAQTHMQNPLGAAQRMTYDEAARLKQATTTNTGAYVHYEYGPYYTSSFASVNNVAANYANSDTYTNQFFDGLGRVFAMSSNHPGSQGGNKGQYTRYDVMGRAVQQTNPFEIDSGWNPTGDDAAGYQFNVANTFDWKGRPLRTYNMDGTYKEASYAGCGCAGGEVVTLTDEVERQQKIYSDMLGRQWKAEVLNADSSVYATTTSIFNARDQVTLVRQYAGTDQSSTYQDTTMSYDGYGRLQSKHVPEQNAGAATTYAYNPDDTINSVTDARGASATYVYNNNRHLVNGINYSAPSGITATSNVTFGYDAVGNRTSMTDGLGSQSYSYNQLSQMTSERRDFADPSASYLNASFTLTYDYNLAGELKTITDPWGATLNYNFDSSGRLNNITGSGYGTVTQFDSNMQYRAWGSLKSETYGNGFTQSASYNNRLSQRRLAAVYHDAVLR